MATYYAYNGTILPALPTYDTDKYPYAVIVQAEQDGVIYSLFAVDHPVFAETVNGSTVYRIDAGSTACLFMASFMSLDTGWVSAGTDQPFAEATYTEPGMNIVWSNHDITFDNGTRQFYASVPVEYNPGGSGETPDTPVNPPVSVNADLKTLSFFLGWLTGRRIRKTWSDLVTTGYNGNYQNLISEFDQNTLTLTFTDSIADTNHNSYVISNDVLTVNTYTLPVIEYKQDSTLTNASLYNGVRLPNLPEGIESYPYRCITTSSGNSYTLTCSISPVYVGTTLGTSASMFVRATYATADYTPNSQTSWTDVATNAGATSLAISNYAVVWTNHDIKRDNEVIFKSSGDPTPV